MNPLCATNKTYRRGTKAPFLQAIASRLLHVGIVGQTKIIIRTHIDDIGTVFEGNVIFLLRNDHTLGLPQSGRLDLCYLVNITLLRYLVTHVSPSNRG